ncbi:MAG: hypothetical protein ACFB0F_05845 [Neomegalonema sp.]
MVEWRRPEWPEARRWSDDPRFEPYAEWCEWVAAPETKWVFETWIVLSRTWHGYPDPPEFAFFAIDAADDVICAADFDWWPKNWKRVEDKDLVRG